MSLDILQRLGRWRAREGAIEVLTPAVVTAAAWWALYGVLASPTPARGLSATELLALLGAALGLGSWALSRWMFLARRRRPWVIALVCVVVSLLVLLILPGRVTASFGARCEALKGEVAPLLSWAAVPGDARPMPPDEASHVVCRLGGVQGNPYLAGALLRPGWNGHLPPALYPLLLGISACAGLALRDRRLVRTRMARDLCEALRLAPAAGHASAPRDPAAKGGRVVACANATFWGELCAQIYSADRVWQPGEVCLRCRQPFTPARNLLRYEVVAPFTADVDVLNGLERIDTVSWPPGEDMPPDARPAATARWVVLGQVTLPDVLSVSQALAIVHDLLPELARSDRARVRDAAELAARKASRVSAWIWSGELSDRLTYARPSSAALLAVGAVRLRDVRPPGGGRLWLQLDLGLLPVELRLGFRRSFGDGRPPVRQNSKTDLWLPVAPPRLPMEEAGRWVPRVEGEALRTWLSTDRFADASGVGRAVPMPYRPPTAEGQISPETDAAPGRLDFVRRPLTADASEPLEIEDPGASIAEWRWLEWQQIELIRQQALVLIDRSQRSSS